MLEADKERAALMAEAEHTEDPDRLGSILAPAAEDRLEAFQVGRYVNQARNEGARCVEPLD